MRLRRINPLPVGARPGTREHPNARTSELSNGHFLGRDLFGGPHSNEAGHSVRVCGMKLLEHR